MFIIEGLLYFVVFTFMVLDIVFGGIWWLLSSSYRKSCVERWAWVQKMERKRTEFTPEEMERMLAPSGTPYRESVEEVDFLWTPQ